MISFYEPKDFSLEDLSLLFPEFTIGAVNEETEDRYFVVFLGPDAKKRAERYMDWVNAPGPLRSYY